MDKHILSRIKRLSIPRNRKGFGYIDALIGTLLIGTVGVQLTSQLPILIKTTEKLNTHIQLVQAADYVFNYLIRWTNLPMENKSLPLNSYSAGDEIDPLMETRINHLMFASSLAVQEFADARTMPDQYKTLMTVVTEAVNPLSGSDLIIVKVTVWYDENMDNSKQSSEPGFSFRVTALEKMGTL